MAKPDPEAIIGRARRRVIRAFTEAGATSPEAAMTYEPASGIDERQFAKLRHIGAIITVLDGRQWLDRDVLALLDKKTRTRVGLGIGAGLAVAAVGAGAFFWLRGRSDRDEA
jgi:hypothetical protein